MKNTRLSLITLIITLGTMNLSACGLIEHDPNDIKSISEWTEVDAYYNQIELNWIESFFVHNSLRINIPETWPWSSEGAADKRSDFDGYDKHDLLYEYRKRTTTYYSGDQSIETEFRDLDHENPEESVKNFQINITSIDIDSKLLIQDELINDYYFKYDTNAEYYNYCYFKIAKNDVNQLKSGTFNEIRLSLVVLTHLDSSTSFKLKAEDGISEVGYYSDVGIYFNPDLV